MGRRSVAGVAAWLLCGAPMMALAMPPPPLPGVVFPAPRRGSLLANVAKVEECCAPAPVTTIEPGAAHGSDRRVEPMTWFVMTGIGQHLRGEPTGQAVFEAIEVWARTGALEDLRPVGEGGSLARSRYTLKRALLPLIAGYAVLRRDLDPPGTSKRLIQAWLGRLVDLARPADGPMTARNNHRYMRDAILVAWGALTGDPAEFAEGVRGVEAAIAAMDPDGGWPLELARGPKALFYQRHAIASLVAAAEIAHVQGIDLYRPDPSGRSLHLAIGFMLDGIDRADPNQDLSFIRARGNGRHYLAWSEAYVARFPAHPNAARLRKLTAGAARPLIDDYTGGDVAALVGATMPELLSG